jgi:hypothetical protein
MTKAGIVLILVGLGIAVLGTVQLPLVVWLSGDPTINPVGNGMLTWLSWAVGGMLLVTGAALALIGRIAGKRTPGGTS